MFLILPEKKNKRGLKLILKFTCSWAFVVEGFVLFSRNRANASMRHLKISQTRSIKLFFLKWVISLFSVNYSTCVSPLLFDRVEFSTVICDCWETVTLFAERRAQIASFYVRCRNIASHANTVSCKTRSHLRGLRVSRAEIKCFHSTLEYLKTF